MKKALSIVLTVMLMISLIPTGLLDIAANAETEYISGDYTYAIVNITQKTACITSYTGTETELIIPSVLNGYKVVEIGDGVCEENENIRSVQIPEGVVEIGDYAFNECIRLNDITIPSTVQKMGYNTFGVNGCRYDSGRVNITDLFSWCNIEFGYFSIYNIFGHNKDLYVNGEKITDLIIPEGITEIKDYAFAYANIQSVYLPSSVTYIGDQAFSRTSIEKVYIEDVNDFINITTGSYNHQIFGDYNWDLLIGEEKITDISFPHGTSSIASGLFNSCKSIETVYIPGTVKYLNGSFEYCENLSEVFIDYGVEEIMHSFYGSAAATNSFFVSIPASVNYISNQALDLANDSIFTIGTLTIECIENSYAHQRVPSLTIYSYNYTLHTFDNRCDLKCNQCDYQKRHSFSHIYDAVCDEVCNECGEERSGADHVYDAICDEVCNECGKERSVPDHVYDAVCDVDCNVCGAVYQAPDHTFDHACDTDCNVCGAARVIEHKFDNACDTACNICESVREVPDHIYDHDCDTDCNVCGVARAIEHKFDNACDTMCNICNAVREVPDHIYDHDCDVNCNICGNIREADHLYNNEKSDITYHWKECDCGAEADRKLHSYDTACDIDCNICSAVREVEPHKYFSIYLANESEHWHECAICGDEKNLEKHSYDNACDTDCITCLAVREVEPHDYADATCTTPKTCMVCGDTRGVSLGHSYTNNCDKACNVCGKTRTVGAHKYSNACDTTCNYCNAKRTIKHTYSNSCDTSCNVCKATRTITHAYKTTTTKATLAKSGTIVKKCTVCGKVASTTWIKYVKSISLSSTSYTYDGKVKTPAVIVKDGDGKTISASNYTVSYPSGRTNAGAYKVTVTMKGNYSGSKTLSFKINPMSSTKCSAKLAATSYTYNGAVKTPAVTIKNAAGVVLKNKTDYTVTYASGRKNAGTYKVTIKMKGNYSGTKTLSFKINPIDISKCSVKLSATSYIYNGKVKGPAVTVKNASGTTLTKGTHYTTAYAAGRTNVGTYKVTVKMKGNYTGTKTLTFKINPAATTVSKLTAGSKSITVAISKRTAQVTGYQIQYSTSAKFTNATTKTIGSYNTTKYTLKSLGAKKGYYVRVRTYKKVGSATYYSGWSTAKYVKTK